MNFQIKALPEFAFSSLFGMTDAELAEHNACRQIVTTKPGTPCRVSMADAEVGDTVILCNYPHQPAKSPYQATHAIFVRETGCRIIELRVLRLIDDMPGTTFAEIAKSTGLERSLTSRIIQILLKADLIEREASKSDARVFLLKTTKNGKDVRKVARQLSDRLEAILQKPLTEQEMRALDQVLERLGNWITSDTYHTALNDI